MRRELGWELEEELPPARDDGGGLPFAFRRSLPPPAAGATGGEGGKGGGGFERRAREGVERAAAAALKTMTPSTLALPLWTHQIGGRRAGGARDGARNVARPAAAAAPPQAPQAPQAPQ